MMTQKGYILLLFSNVINLILLIECSSDKVNDEYDVHRSVENRIKRSLTTICVEIKPSHSQEKPYLMCKGGKLHGIEQQVPNTKNNIYVNSDHNIITTAEYGQVKKDYVSRKPAPYFQNLISNENSWLEEGENYQSSYLSNQNPNQQPTFDTIKFRHTQPADFYSETDTARFNSDRYDQRFLTLITPTLNSGKYREENKKPTRYYNFKNGYLEMKQLSQSYGYDQSNDDYLNKFDKDNYPVKHNLQPEIWNFSQSIDNSIGPLQHLLSAPILAPETITAVPSDVKHFPFVNDPIQNAVRSRDIKYERKPSNTGQNGLDLDSFPQSMSESYRKKQIFKNFNTLPFGDDPVMQQFHNSLYDTPVLTIAHTDKSIVSQPKINEINILNQQYSAESVHDTLHHNTIRSPSIQEDQCDDFRKEVSSNQYCNGCSPDMGYTLPSIFITFPCYHSDSLPYYRSLPPTYNSQRYKNFVSEKQYLKQPEQTGLVGSSHNPLIKLFQSKLFPYFSMIPRFGNLLSSARTILPTLHVAHGIFRCTTPIPGKSKPFSLTYTSQQGPNMFPNILNSHIRDITVATQQENIQTTSLPTKTTVDAIPLTSIKSITDLQKSTEDSSLLQRQSQSRNFTTIKPIAITLTTITEDKNQTGEESTKKFLTIIEKARRLQMRHRINNNN